MPSESAEVKHVKLQLSSRLRGCSALAHDDRWYLMCLQCLLQMAGA